MSAVEKRDRLLARLDRHLRLWVSSLLFELRRTRRVIVDPSERPRGEPPIFLVGVHRSGTTLLRLVIDSHPRIACPPESFFIAPLRGLLEDAKAMEGLAAMGFPREQVLAKLRETVSYFFEMYAAARGKARWADKTPSYVDCLDFIDELYGPDCRYVLIFRHGLDSASSIAQIGIREVEPHVAACGNDRYAGAARYWAAQTRKILAFRERHPDRCIALRYEELTREPEHQLRPVFAFLDEPWEPGVLRFAEQPHDEWIGLQDGGAARSTGFTPSVGRYAREPVQVVERMLREAEPVLRELGYTLP